MKKTHKNIIVVLVILVVVFLIAWPKIQETSAKEEAAAAAPVAERPIPVQVVVIQPEAFNNTLKVTGSIKANEMLDLRSEVAGVLENINFEEGSPIRKGQLLFTIRSQDLYAQLEKARARQQLFEDTENRYQQLLEREAVSQEEYDIAVNDLRSAQADIALLQAQLAKTRVHAPFDGQVGLRFVSEGSYVPAGTPVASLYDLEPAKIEFSVPGKYSGELVPGDNIRFTTDATEEEFKGVIYAVEPQIDPATRTIRMRATSPNKERKLLPGQFARIWLTLEEQDDALLVPTQAVVPELNGHKVFVLRQGKVAEVPVEIGLRSSTDVQIVSGLEQGDTVLTTGILQAKPGAAVNVTGIYSGVGGRANVN